MRAEHNTTLERMQALIERLTEADVAYYKNDEPIMSDWEYDQYICAACDLPLLW